MSQETSPRVGFPETGTAGRPSGYEALLGSLETSMLQLERVIANRSSEALRQPGQDGRWGVVEVLCHLRDWEDVIHDRIWQIVEGERPTFDDPDAAMWPLEHEYRAQDGHEVFGELAAMRRSLVERLREVDEAAWARTGVLEGRGEMTLHDLLRLVVEHDHRYLEEAREAIT